MLSAGLVGALLGDVVTGEADLTNSPESYRADDLVDERLPPDPNDFTEVVVVGSDKLAAGERRFAETVDDVRAELEEIPGVSVPAGEQPPVSPDRHAVLIPIRMNFATRSRPGCHSSSSPCCSGSRWTTTSSC